MATRTAIARAVGSFSSTQISAARPLATSFTRTWQQPRTTSRAFSISARAQAKRFTQDHEWIELSDDGTTGTIGISKYAANALGDVVFVELPTPDLEVNAGDSIGAVESVKSASDIMTPVSGTIIEGNGVLEEKPGTINQGPEGEGWIAKIRVKDPKEVEALMDVEAYDKFTQEAES
ncbi:glycine cleavage H-protein-domain-containing protein [Cryomyces antarcticus]